MFNIIGARCRVCLAEETSLALVQVCSGILLRCCDYVCFLKTKELKLKGVEG